MSFADQLGGFATRTKAKMDTVVRESVISFVVRVVRRSPVDTGLFRGSWRYSAVAYDLDVPTTLDKDGSATIAEVRRLMPEHPAGLVHYLTNQQPYGTLLELGSSKQAPQGMVGVTAVEWPSIVAQQARAA